MSATTPERGRHGATLTVETIADAAVLRIGGELDLLTVPGLQARLHDAVAATSGAVIADLTEVRFLSSSGLTLLLGLQSELAAQFCHASVGRGGEALHIDAIEDQP